MMSDNGFTAEQPPFDDRSQPAKTGPPDLPDELNLEGIEPNGPPQAVRKAAGGLNFLAGATIVLVSGASTMFVLGGSVGTCRGATRSSRLEWQERQAELQIALEAEQSASDDDTKQ